MTAYPECSLDMLAAANPVPHSMEHKLAEEASALFQPLVDRARREERSTPSPPAFLRRPLLAAALALLVIGAVVGPALAFRAQIIDFFTATQAPKGVVVDFARLEVEQKVSVPNGVFPNVHFRDARRIASVRTGTTRSVLYVAPASDRSFCAMWAPTDAPRCYSPQRARGALRFAELSWSSMYPALGVDTVEGVVYARGASVDLQYADGVKIAIPYIWVTAPINAGFFIYRVPADRRLGNDRPVALIVARSGKTLARQSIENVAVTIGSGLVDHRDRWGISIQTPREAVWSKRRLLYSFNLSDGSLIEAWVMPSRRSIARRCVTSSFSTGCEAVPLAGPPVQLQILGGGTAGQEAVLYGEVAKSVRAVELIFQRGARQTVRPRSGLVLVKINLAHSRLNSRLVRVLGLDGSGRVVGVEHYDPATPGVYPCSKPKDYGYGVTRCP